MVVPKFLFTNVPLSHTTSITYSFTCALCKVQGVVILT